VVTGICKARDEAHIIGHTLDRWARYCDTIHVYDDASTDDTPGICEAHPSVVEVVRSTLVDSDRLRAEWFNRQQILQSALRFNPEWVVYFDADEWPEGVDVGLMETADRIDCLLYDVHITPDDVDGNPEDRQWVDPTPRHIPFFFRNRHLSFSMPDQRVMHHKPGRVAVSGKVKHYGKGWSVEQWEKKVEYYGNTFGRYAAKWRARKGRAVKHDYRSDFGKPLVRFDDV